MTHSTGGTSLQRLDRKGATDDWYTPPEVLAALGPFDLDPCVPLVGPGPGNLAPVWYTAADDGLSKAWHGFVWLNPPYSAPGPWLRKMAEHGHGIALIFARTETGWWHEHVWPRATSFLFLRGRVSFLEPSTRDRKGHNAPAPSVLVAYGLEADRRLRTCGIAGSLVRAAAAEGAPQ
jgi:phage N-6-adenine-methyltransferase